MVSGELCGWCWTRCEVDLRREFVRLGSWRCGLVWRGVNGVLGLGYRCGVVKFKYIIWCY